MAECFHEMLIFPRLFMPPIGFVLARSAGSPSERYLFTAGKRSSVRACKERNGHVVRVPCSCLGGLSDQNRCDPQFTGMVLNLLQRGGNFMHVFLVSEQGWLWDPHRFPSCAMSFRKIFLQKWVCLFGLPAGQLPSIFAAFEHVQLMQRRVACLIGNALGIHGSNELFKADAPESVAINMKNVSVLSIARTLRGQFLWGDAFDIRKQTVEQTCVLVAVRSLLIEACELGAKDGALPFTEPVIGPINEVAVEPLARHSATIVDGAGQALDFVIVGDDDATFACGHQLAGLKTERCRPAECSDSLSPPFAAVSMGTVLHQGNTAVASNFAETIEIGRVSAHMHRNDGFRPRGDSCFNQVRINTIRIR